LLEAAVILLRLVQYGAASILLGSSLLILHVLPVSGPFSAASLAWPRALVGAAAIVLLCATVAGLLAQTAIMAGSMSAALTLPSIEAVVAGMDLGKAALVRATAAGAAAMVLLPPSPRNWRWVMTAALGGVASASFAWMGHGAATEGAGAIVHLLSDIFHSWAAAAWIGALCAFFFLLWQREPVQEASRITYRALERFSGVGTVLVGTLMVTGLINSWFLVGPENVQGLLRTDYGVLLALKLAIFAGMLAIAGTNRYWLTPRLGGALGAPASTSQAIRALRRSVMIETTLGFGVLGAIAWYGTLPPPAAM
jgi:copper resistance protein D